MRTLRSRVIHLAHSHPEFRGQLLPLLKEAKEHNPGDVWKTIFGGWRAMGRDGEARSFKSQEEARGFTEGEEKEKKEESGKHEKQEADRLRKKVPDLKKEIDDIEKMSDKEVEDKRLKELEEMARFELQQEDDPDLEGEALDQRVRTRSLSRLKDEKKGDGVREKMLKRKKDNLSKSEASLKRREEGEGSKSEKKASLRSRVIHLAHTEPELRPHLLPLLKS